MFRVIVGAPVKLRAQVDMRSGKRATYAQLAKDLGRSEFQQFMLRKTVNELVARARERLMRLSGERYALVVRDDDFYVIDNDNAGEERPAVTLTRARRAGEQLVAEEAWGADDDLEEVREDGAQRRAP